MSETENKTQYRAMVIILDQPSLMDDIISGFLDLGVPGATIMESKGMGQIIRQDMPMFAGLAGLFSESTGSRVIMSVMTKELVDSVYKLIEELAGQFELPKSIICFTLPVDDFRSFRG